MNTIFKNPAIKPYFNKKGDWILPSGNILYPGQIEPKLSMRAWSLLLLLESNNVPKKALELLGGSRTTQWRAKNELKAKGYL